MKLIKYTHACVRLESERGVLVFDPSGFAEPAALDGADAVLVTHEHFDHVAPERLVAAGVPVWAPAPVAEQLAGLGDRVTRVRAGDVFEAAGYRVRTFGGLHAVMHPEIPQIPNVAYLVDGVYHPGDSFVVPDAPVRTLLLPISAPWLKLSEVIDFARAVGAPRAVPIHELVGSEMGYQITEHRVSSMAPGTEYRWLAPTESIEI